MHDRVFAIVAKAIGNGAPSLRSQLVDRLAVELAVDVERAKQVVRDLLEDGVIDPVTVCHYRASDARVVMEAGLVRGGNFAALHAAGA